MAASTLVRGDRVVVAPGEAFPADGAIVRGATEVDEALVTGESLPVARGLGDSVVGGSRNALAEVEVEISAAAREGTLARIASLLERAQLERPQIQHLADRVASVFAPLVLAITAATALVWALLGATPLDVAMTASAVLIVACPCALGLATPAAMTAALGRGARFGLLFKSGEAIERCAAADTVLLDKTGTLTEGRLAVSRIVAAAGIAEQTVLAHAVAVEGASTHPVADALRRELERRGLGTAAARETRRAIAGRGVLAEDGGRLGIVGTRALLREHAVAVEDGLERAERELARSGASLAWVAEGGHALGLVALVDPLRADARAATMRLRALRLDVVLISGDHKRAVALAAAGAGIDRFAANVLPEQKVEAVQRRRAQGAHVLMAGDGINDAAALAAARRGSRDGARRGGRRACRRRGGARAARRRHRRCRRTRARHDAARAGESRAGGALQRGLNSARGARLARSAAGGDRDESLLGGRDGKRRAPARLAGAALSFLWITIPVSLLLGGSLLVLVLRAVQRGDFDDWEAPLRVTPSTRTPIRSSTRSRSPERDRVDRRPPADRRRSRHRSSRRLHPRRAGSRSDG